MKKCNSSLLNKICTPCQGGMKPLNSKTTSRLLLELGKEWVIDELGHLYKEYSFNNFVHSMDFANKITIISEKEAHHPDLLISWGGCAVSIWTHKINGLTQNDFILAAKIEEI